MDDMIAFVFPGQGAHYPGMGEDLLGYPVVRNCFEEAGEALGYDVSVLCHEEGAEKLKETRWVQPGLFTLETAIARLVMAETGVKPAMAAGLSLGEYAALTIAGAFDFTDAVRLVALRGELMEQAGQGKGSMAAVLGLDRDTVENAVESGRAAGPVWVCNVNAPGQLVIGGSYEGVEVASGAAKELGARRVMPLSVAGPFHTSYLQEAADQLYEALKKVDVNPCTIPVYANVTGKPHEDADSIRKTLSEHVTHPVLWMDCVKAMAVAGCTKWYEMGPGKTVSGLIKKIIKGADTHTINGAASYRKAVEG
jgi:[acyl-carrier-protein] S-malonyltransferase